METTQHPQVSTGEWICLSKQTGLYGKQTGKHTFSFREQDVHMEIDTSCYNATQINGAITQYYPSYIDMVSLAANAKEVHMLIAECLFKTESGLY